MRKEISKRDPVLLIKYMQNGEICESRFVVRNDDELYAAVQTLYSHFCERFPVGLYPNRHFCILEVYQHICADNEKLTKIAMI